MTNLEDLTRSSVEARIEYLIQQRMELGENRQFAEISVTRTEEGRALWNQARKLRMAESADESGPGSTFSHTAASLLGHEARLENLIALRMNECLETREAAELAVIHTSDGLELWERVRALRLAESRDED
jgi:bifunctional ADP-heptose synthase (sugar kinase/adenylyltransferase)